MYDDDTSHKRNSGSRLAMAEDLPRQTVRRQLVCGAFYFRTTLQPWYQLHVDWAIFSMCACYVQGDWPQGNIAVMAAFSALWAANQAVFWTREDA